MIIKLDSDNSLEIVGNKARVIQGGQLGSWHQFEVNNLDKDAVKVEAKGPDLVIISYGNKTIRASISGTIIVCE